MPNVTVQTPVGRTTEQKRKVATAITNALVEHFDAKRENVVVVFAEVPLDSWARGGTLNSDREHK